MVDAKEHNQDLPVGANPLHKLLIHPDTGWKQQFNIWVLLLVAYSCISNILFIAYEVDDTSISLVSIYWVVEIFFYLDFILNWFSGYRDEDQKVFMEYKAIAVNYLKTWFIIDFVSIFPF